MTAAELANDLLDGSRNAGSLGDAELRAVYELAVARYRAFDPIMPDEVFDTVLAPEFAARFPDDPLLTRPEPESAETLGGKAVRHEIPMLSTEKCYSREEVERFVQRIIDAGLALGLAPNEHSLRVTQKLDGLAGTVNSRGQLLTRGENGYGFDISHIVRHGIDIDLETPGIGELVLSQQVFAKLKVIDPDIKHPRNVVGGIVSADTLSTVGMMAVEAHGVRFIRYDTLPAIEVPADAFMADFDEIVAQAEASYDFCLTDGLVIESTHPAIKQRLGATSHHHRWQAALKKRGDTAVTTVRSIELGVGRTGRITPVVHYDPVNLSGATLAKVTGHSVGRLHEKGINVGAKIRMIRSGEVIPHILEVVEPVETPFQAMHCPSCGSPLVEDGTDDEPALVCPNAVGCPAQSARTLKHFFQLTKIRGFGTATVELLVENGFTSLLDVFGMTVDDFRACGLGDKQSANLATALDNFLDGEIDDWLLVAAMGIPHLGRGDARKLLAAYPIEQVGSLTADKIRAINGFGPITSPVIAEGLRAAWETLSFLLQWGVRPVASQPSSSNPAADCPIAGKRIVFTGTMRQGTREEMKAQARNLGAQVQSSVNGKTDFLVAGEKAGASKLDKARKQGVLILTESEYLARLAS